MMDEMRMAMQNILSALLARLAQEVVHLLKLAMMALPVDIIRIIMIIDIAVCPSPLHPNVIKIIRVSRRYSTQP